MKQKALLEIHQNPAESENLPSRRGLGYSLTFRARATFLLVIATLLLAGNSIHAPDPGFSQFFSSPLTLNPALTGKFNGVVRAAGNHRHQRTAIKQSLIT